MWRLILTLSFVGCIERSLTQEEDWEEDVSFGDIFQGYINPDFLVGDLPLDMGSPPDMDSPSEGGLSDLGEMGDVGDSLDMEENPPDLATNPVEHVLPDNPHVGDGNPCTWDPLCGGEACEHPSRTGQYALRELEGFISVESCLLLSDGSLILGGSRLPEGDFESRRMAVAGVSSPSEGQYIRWVSPFAGVREGVALSLTPEGGVIALGTNMVEEGPWRERVFLAALESGGRNQSETVLDFESPLIPHDITPRKEGGHFVTALQENDDQRLLLTVMGGHIQNVFHAPNDADMDTRVITLAPDGSGEFGISGNLSSIAQRGVYVIRYNALGQLIWEAILNEGENAVELKHLLAMTPQKGFVHAMKRVRIEEGVRIDGMEVTLISSAAEQVWATHIHKGRGFIYEPLAMVLNWDGIWIGGSLITREGWLRQMMVLHMNENGEILGEWVWGTPTEDSTNMVKNLLPLPEGGVIASGEIPDENQSRTSGFWQAIHPSMGLCLE